MPRAELVVGVPIERTPRVMQLEGLFDVAPAKRSEVRLSVDLPIEARDWNIGLIVGPSGSGKSTIARELFGDALVAGYDWPRDRSLVDGFLDAMGIKEVTGLLSSVGFSSPPSWLRPFRVLSNGEQFRATIARAMAEAPDLAVIDEFTSVVDRTVAQIGSAAVAKAVRQRGQKLIAVSCHRDIVEWLQPDWIYQPEPGGAGEFQWRSLRRRPGVALKVVQVSKAAWSRFRAHHYLDGSIHRSARCYVALLGADPIAFYAVVSFAHPTSPGWRGHRCVVLPDYQGIGIGMTLAELVASIFACSKPFRAKTGNPAMIAHRSRSSAWRMLSPPGAGHRRQTGLWLANKARRLTESRDRVTASFEYVGPLRPDLARRFGLGTVRATGTMAR